MRNGFSGDYKLKLSVLKNVELPRVILSKCLNAG